jgi:hypothetical protein
MDQKLLSTEQGCSVPLIPDYDTIDRPIDERIEKRLIRKLDFR